MDIKDKLNRFLTDVERRAFKMARFATGNTDEALDLVQDAMFGFVRHYTSRPEGEWNVLFYTILRSRITDWYRRNSVRKRVLSWLGRANNDCENGEDPIQDVPDTATLNPFEDILRHEEAMALERAIQMLPIRQQQAFLLRVWEEMDVRQTALVMGCSEGSVKAHYSRAVHTLRSLLEDIR
ncbi:MAG TPA: RNA polymerase sigma factor [Thermodesulfobacteriota bacterium]|nr:RNA polymerase sigma factor [Thermodesulfobacteriota bacterium]